MTSPGSDFARRVRPTRRVALHPGVAQERYGITTSWASRATRWKPIRMRACARCRRRPRDRPSRLDASPARRASRARTRRGELARANEQIRKLTGRNARGYRSPSWDLSPHSVELLLKHGFVYDSSMMADDYTPYRVRQGDVIELEAPGVFGPATKLIEMPISWTLDDYPHFEFIRTDVDTARQHERERRAAELDRRFRLSRGESRVGRHHLHLSPVRDRARPSHGRARSFHSHDDRPRRRRFHEREDAAGEFDQRIAPAAVEAPSCRRANDISVQLSASF